MPVHVLIIDLFGLVLAAAGFGMAFRQACVRRLLEQYGIQGPPPGRDGPDDDPLTYVLRIAGTMIMVFGVVIAGMVTLFQVAQS